MIPREDVVVAVILVALVLAVTVYIVRDDYHREQRREQIIRDEEHAKCPK